MRHNIKIWRIIKNGRGVTPGLESEQCPTCTMFNSNEVEIKPLEAAHSFNYIDQLNIDKINSRKKRGVIGGNGDNR